MSSRPGALIDRRAITRLQVQGLCNLVVDEDLMAAVNPSGPETESLCKLEKVVRRQVSRAVQRPLKQVVRFHRDLDWGSSNSSLILVSIRLVEKRRDLRPKRPPVILFTLGQPGEGLGFAHAG